MIYFSFPRACYLLLGFITAVFGDIDFHTVLEDVRTPDMTIQVNAFSSRTNGGLTTCGGNI
jgi:hypothetical protein